MPDTVPASITETERNLLVGVLALQVELVDGRQLADAWSTWSARPTATLADVFVERGAITFEERRELERLLKRKLARHGNDARAALAALTGNPLERALEAVRDPRARSAAALVRGASEPDLSTALCTTPGLVRQLPIPALPAEDFDGPSAEEATPSGKGFRNWSARHPWLVNPTTITLLILAAVGAALLATSDRRSEDGSPMAPDRGAVAGRRPMPSRPGGRDSDPFVDELFRSIVRKEDVLDFIARDPTMTFGQRRSADMIARFYVANPTQLNDAAWYIVRSPHAKPEAYAYALAEADEACRIQPGNGFFVNTLGVALYRCGRLDQALKALNESLTLNNQGPLGPHPADLAFLAMIHAKQGHKDKAKDFLRQLRDAVKQGQWEFPRENESFLREAEELVGAMK